MSAARVCVVAVTTIMLLTVVRKPLHGQGLTEPGPVQAEPRDARLQYGPLALAPTLRLTNVGFDSNVFSENDARQPKSDFTAKVTPAVGGWLTLPRVRVVGDGKLDFVYYNEFSGLRSVDPATLVRADVLLKYISPYVGGTFVNTRHGGNYEIDVPVRRTTGGLFAGARVRLTGKSSIDITARRNRTDYGNSTLTDDNELADQLDYTSEGVGATMWYALTPLTKVGLEVQRSRDRFDSDPERNANQTRVAPVVEFRPDAVISGRVTFGVYKRANVGRDLPAYNGSFVLMAIRYTLLGRTRFEVQADRDLEYSYRQREQAYQYTGFDVSVTHRLADPWDVHMGMDRHRLTYVTGTGALIPASEVKYIYRAGVGYRVGRSRLVVSVSYLGRQSEVSASRDFQRVRIMSSLVYALD